MIFPYCNDFVFRRDNKTKTDDMFTIYFSFLLMDGNLQQPNLQLAQSTTLGLCVMQCKEKLASTDP